MNTQIESDPTEWQEFCQALDVAALVPEAYLRYRAAVVDGMAFFLGRLSGERAFALLAAQAMLPETAGPGERLVTIARDCPALHKLGQVLARDRRLSAGLRALLQGLETMPASIDADEARRLVERELGPLAPLGVAIEEPPLAEASVALVIPFVWRAVEAGEETVRRGVFKLLKPGVEERLNEDLAILGEMGALLDERCEAYGLPRMAYQETFAEVRGLLAREVRLDVEQENMRQARVALADLKAIVIPEVYPFCTPRLTAMQRLDGCKVTDAASLSAGARQRLAGHVIRALIARTIWSNRPVTMFHADPHAGNLMATDDGRLGLLDWSLVGHLDKDAQVQLTQLLIGALTTDAGRITAAIEAIARGAVDHERLAGVVERAVARLRDGSWPGLGWLTQLMDETATEARARMPGDLVMYRKVLKTLEDVIADVSPRARVDRVLIAAFLRQLAREWSARSWTMPFSHHFGSHFSTAELAQLWMSAPLIGQRQWFGLQARLLRRIGGFRAGATGGEAGGEMAADGSAGAGA